MNLHDWAIRHNIPNAAIQDLAQQIGMAHPEAAAMPGASEAAVQTQVRLQASQAGSRLWRNNVGATYTKDGAFLRYGLANDSSQMNSRLKSSDLIGIKPVLIGPEHTGRTIGQFVAREVKRGDWKYAGTKREVAQLAFLTMVSSLGGDANFTTGGA